MVLNSLNYLGWNKRDLVAADLKRIYSAATEAEAKQYLTEFEAIWNTPYPTIAQS
jgi:putative transposase